MTATPTQRIPEADDVRSVRLLRQEQLDKDAFEEEGPRVGEPFLPDLARSAQETLKPHPVRADDEQVDVVVRRWRYQTVHSSDHSANTTGSKPAPLRSETAFRRRRTSPGAVHDPTCHDEPSPARLSAKMTP